MLNFFLVNFKQMKGQSNGNDKKGFNFDAEHERKRKDQMKKLLERTQKDIEEEQMLLNELKKIEQRKKERDRKTQDLQKLISQADQVSGQCTVHTIEFFFQKINFIYSPILSINSKVKHHKHRPVHGNKIKRSTRRNCQTKYDHRELILLLM